LQVLEKEVLEFANKFLHPAITTLFALNVSRPAVFTVAVSTLACRYKRAPVAIPRFTVLLAMRTVIDTELLELARL
jgi:hypothetical protein